MGFRRREETTLVERGPLFQNTKKIYPGDLESWELLIRERLSLHPTVFKICFFTFWIEAIGIEVLI